MRSELGKKLAAESALRSTSTPDLRPSVRSKRPAAESPDKDDNSKKIRETKERSKSVVSIYKIPLTITQ
jgi:hypothetical protein